VTVHVEQATSEVVAEPAGSAAQADGLTWEDEERWRALRERIRRDAARTQAEDYGD
jgi:hypothetical protein